MKKLESEHNRIDWLLAQHERAMNGHRYLDVVQHYYEYRSALAYLDELVNLQ